MSDIIEKLRALAFVRPMEKCIPEAADEIARLRAELADYKDAAASEAERVNELTAENRSLREENALLLEALKPFAKMADELDADELDDEWENDDTQWINVNKFGAMPTVGDLRRARAAIREAGKND